jgi:hypothetical protein
LNDTETKVKSFINILPIRAQYENMNHLIILGRKEKERQKAKPFEILTGHRF